MILSFYSSILACLKVLVTVAFFLMLSYFSSIFQHMYVDTIKNTVTMIELRIYYLFSLRLKLAIVLENDVLAS